MIKIVRVGEKYALRKGDIFSGYRYKDLRSIDDHWWCRSNKFFSDTLGSLEEVVAAASNTKEYRRASFEEDVEICKATPRNIRRMLERMRRGEDPTKAITPTPMDFSGALRRFTVRQRLKWWR